MSQREFTEKTLALSVNLQKKHLHCLKLKPFSNGIQLIFQWKSNRFPMEIETFSNGI